jgi:hypothetical protein
MTNDQKKLIRSICASNGDRFAPRQLVANARSKTSILHELFTWDDKKAGDRYRLIEAQELIRSINVTVIHEERPIKVNKYVHDAGADPGDPCYLPVEVLRAASDEAKKAQLRYEIRQMLGHLERVRNLALYLGMAEEIDEVSERVRKLYQSQEVRV